MRFLETAADIDGALLRIETVNPPTGVAEPERVHPRQETRAEVVSGTFALCRRGEERRLGPAEAIATPAGTPHHFVKDGDVNAIAIRAARPTRSSARSRACAGCTPEC